MRNNELWLLLFAIAGGFCLWQLGVANTNDQRAYWFWLSFRFKLFNFAVLLRNYAVLLGNYLTLGRAYLDQGWNYIVLWYFEFLLFAALHGVRVPRMLFPSTSITCREGRIPKDLNAPLQYGILRVVMCETICLSSICRSLHNLLSVRCVFKSRRSPRSVTFMPGNDLFRVVRIANLKLSTSQVASLLQNSSRSRGDVNRR